MAAPFTDMARVGLWLGPDAHLVQYPVAQGAAVNLVAVVAEAWEQAGLERPRRAGRDPRALRRLVRRRAPSSSPRPSPGRNTPSPRSTRAGRG